MISLDKLKSVTHLVTHGPACPDGISSALIIKDALPDVRVSFMAYNTAELAALPAEPGLLFVDFTPPRDRVQEFVEAGALVLDHHPTARDIVAAFGENGVFGENEKNECGAWLAYEQAWLPLNRFDGAFSVDEEIRRDVKDFAYLAAVRDTWKKDDPYWQRACEQAALLLFWQFKQSLFEVIEEDKNGILGKHLLDKQLSAAQRSIAESHHFQTERGTRVLMFQGVSTTSDAAELVEKSDVWIGKPPDLVVGFHYKIDAGKLQLQFSMRSHTGYDCAAFAKAHGGGGHTAAAGFTVSVSPELSANPYAVFRILLGEWETGR